MSHKSLFSLTLLVMIIVACALCLNAAYVRKFRGHNSPPHRQAYAIEADSDGFIWIYTASGLSRYDGNEFRVYELDGLDKQHDYAPYATRMECGEDGVLWVSVNSGQVFRYNADQDRFDKKIDLAREGIDERLYNIKPDREGVLLCTSGGLYSWRDNELKASGLRGKTIRDILNGGDGYWYAAASDGLYRFDRNPAIGGDADGIRIKGSESIRFDRLAQVGRDIIAATFSNGIYVVDSAGVKTCEIECGVPKLPVTALLTDCDSVVYVAVDGAGIYSLNTTARKATRKYYYDPSHELLSANTVSDLCSDGDGGIWVCTSSHGINHISNEINRVSIVRHDMYNTNSLTADCVNAVYEDADGDMWYGTDAGLSLCRRDGRWSHFFNRENDIDRTILAITQSPDGLIYVGGYGMGVWTVDKKTGAARQLPPRNHGSGIGTDYVFTIFSGERGMWFGGIQGDLTFHDTSCDTWQYFPAECICDIVAADDGTVYISGCEGLAIYRYGSDSMAWKRNIGGVEINTLPRSIDIDRKANELWIATEGQGIIRLDLDTQKASIFEPESGASPKNVIGLVIDSLDRIWFYTEDDLYLIDKARKHTYRITPILELTDVNFMPRSVILDSKGNLVVGTTDGALTVNTGIAHERGDSPKIIFTDLSVNYEPYLPHINDEVLPRSIDRMERLTLRHNQNSLIIHVSALQFESNESTAYEWRLKGYDKNWMRLDESNNIVCRDLPYGKYVLEVRAVDRISDTIVAERQLEIRVCPPFWLTWWAIAISAVVLVAAVIFLLRYIRNRQRERRITDKIHSFLNIVHDLRTPVTLIKAPLGELDSCKDLPEDARRNVQLAMKNVERLLSMIGRILDLRRESSHSECLNLAETDMENYLNSKIDEWRVAAIQKGLSISVSVAPDMPTVRIDRNKLSHILDNLLSNAIKYTYEGSVTVKASAGSKHWTLEIADTGIGIPRRDRRRLFRSQYRGENAVSTNEIGSGMGLLIVHRLCLLHKARIRLMSADNGGTIFILTFPTVIDSAYRSIPAETTPEQTEPQQENDTAADESKDTVMLIDDEKEILDYLAESLSGAYNVVKFSDASEALRNIDEVNPSIVVSDVRLKGMSGFELCQKLKSAIETSHIPVILLSALSERQNIILGLESGANDYIVKPFDISVLRLRIKNILAACRLLQSKIVTETTASAESDLIGELDREFMNKVHVLIDANIGNPDYSISDLCGDIAMSRTAVYNKIKALTGASINDYIKLRRLNKAKELLAEHSRPIADVAYMVGFSDPKYFSTCFKKFFGVSPSKI